jgi:hypothetical protein
VSFKPFDRAPRNADVGTLHTTFFVTAIATILCIRTQLWLTHYPQLGGNGLHIAHLLWGGLFMVIAIAILLSLLGRRPRQVAALVGGVGFAFFIDELGKFITSDNNYFFKPAAGIIYLVFVILFLASRAYRNHRGLNEGERVRNAIELIGEATTSGTVAEQNRARALALLADVSPSNPLREPLTDLVAAIDTRPDPNPPWYQRAADSLATHYLQWTERPWFHRLAIAVCAIWALGSVLALVGLVFGGFGTEAAHHGFLTDSINHMAFVNWASVASTLVSTLFMAIALERLLRHDRLDAYEWVTRALIVSIFITRVFAFVESQFGAVFGLAVDVLLLISVRLMAKQEARRQLLQAEQNPPRPGEAAAPAPG